LSARLLATVCLLCVSTISVRSETLASSGSGEVDVYLKSTDDNPSWIVSVMKAELGSLMHSAGYRLEWRSPKKSSSSINTGRLIVVELRGMCTAPVGATDPILVPTSLASSSVVNGRVLPFSHVDCPVLSRLLGPYLANETETAREYVYGRAIARLLAHEFYHVLGQTTQHTGVGVSKERFTASDLLGDHFDFEDGALSRLRPSVEPGPDGDEIDDKGLSGK